MCLGESALRMKCGESNLQSNVECSIIIVNSVMISTCRD